jgi:hypothetical protein
MTSKGVILFAIKAVSLAAIARSEHMHPRIRLGWLAAHENFTRSAASDDSLGFSLIASRQPR